MATRATGPLQNWREAESPAAGRQLADRLRSGLEAQWSQWPLLVPVLIGAGIALWFGLPLVGQRRAAFLAALALGLLGLACPGRARAAVGGGALLVALGLLVADLRSQKVAAPVLHHRLAPAEMRGTVEAVGPWRGGEATRLLLRTDPGGLRVAITLPDPPPPGLAPGARIAVPAMFEGRRGPLVPGGFDGARRAWFEGVSASGRATGPAALLAPAPPTLLAQPLARARAAIDRFLARTLGPELGALASALVTGSRGGIPEPLREAIAVAGLAHLITVSGFHVGVVAGGAFLLVRRLPLLLPMALALSLPLRPLAALAATLVAWAYVGLAGAEVPAVRAGIMVSVVMLAVALGRDPFSLRLLALAATLLLLAWPEMLLSASFQLSFAAVLTLLLLAGHPGFQRLFGPAEEGPVRRFFKGLAALLVTSLAIELVLMPIALAHFGRAGTWGVLANGLAIPLTSFVLMPGLALHLVAGALGLGSLTAAPLAAGLSAFAGLAQGVAALPGARIAVPAIAPLAYGLLVAGGLAAGLLAGRARLLGLALLAAGLLVELRTARPDLYISGDARQVGVVGPGPTLFLARGRGHSAEARAWAAAAGARAVAPLHAMGGAACSAGGCAVRLSSGLDLLVVTAALPLPPEALRAACARADLVVGEALDRRSCTPRWRAIDRDALVGRGATTIRTSDRRLVSAADLTGDHPWSLAALPGVQKRLIGPDRWVEPVAG
ncbi:ComEC/Rec2 family competence protein [Thermaurantiacus sp.]